jgi:hypothetical protein
MSRSAWPLAVGAEFVQFGREVPSGSLERPLQRLLLCFIAGESTGVQS